MKCFQREVLCVFSVCAAPVSPDGKTFCDPLPVKSPPPPPWVTGDGLTVTVASQSLKGGSHVHLSAFSQERCPLPHKERPRALKCLQIVNEATVVPFQCL